MTDAHPAADDGGKFRDPTRSRFPCPYCGRMKVRSSVWMSHNGRVDDIKFDCIRCGKSWWVDGTDTLASRGNKHDGCA